MYMCKCNTPQPTSFRPRGCYNHIYENTSSESTSRMIHRKPLYIYIYIYISHINPTLVIKSSINCRENPYLPEIYSQNVFNIYSNFQVESRCLVTGGPEPDPYTIIGG